MIEISTATLGLVPIIVGLVELYKLYLPKKYAQLVALFLGVLGGLFFTNLDIPMAVLSGIVIGLTASGLYSQSKNIFK